MSPKKLERERDLHENREKAKCVITMALPSICHFYERVSYRQLIAPVTIGQCLHDRKLTMGIVLKLYKFVIF